MSTIKKSIGTDDDSFKLTMIALPYYKTSKLKDGGFVKTGKESYGIIKCGILSEIDKFDIPVNIILAFKEFDSLPEPPQFPYIIEIKEVTNE